MQLRERNEIREKFVFRLGELHIVFAMLKVIGKYVDQSGIDRLFIEAGIYGETTLKQLIDGKHTAAHELGPVCISMPTRFDF